MSKQARQSDSESVAPSPASKRRRASPLQFWCDSFDRTKHLLGVLKTWRASEHRIRHARSAIEKGEAVPADLKHIIDAMEAAMQPLPVGTELYFATYDPKWKYNPEWWLPCSRTNGGAERSKRHHGNAPAGTKIHVHKLVLEEGISGLWAGRLGTEHDDEEEIVLAGDLSVKRGSGHYRVSLPEPSPKKKHVAHPASNGDEPEDDAHSEEGEQGEDESVEEVTKVQKEDGPSSFYCVIS